ncbi:nuclear transport factor 2 family protein [Streptomyces gilvus]|uniref:nuclear transport factor 2 family protein n=1 Tax=Streptomyces gilvus TaxID=2920937 RepID=UPI001F0FDF35|nr:nuclear transport factor 2 family protein [Streptomyces sp. CME 23]MCH5675867.1 nuclear transport factor 2 family protein [Streptomyces sp. CME 23]
MTTHPNATRLHQAYQALEQGDMQPMLGLLTDDVTWIDSTLGPLAGTYRGKAEVPEFFAKMMEVYEGSLRVEIVAVVADDDHAIVLTRESGSPQGHTVAWTGAHVWSFTGDHCHRFVNYGSAEYQRFWSDQVPSARR